MYKDNDLVIPFVCPSSETGMSIVPAFNYWGQHVCRETVLTVLIH
jgi:hypothetical protein